MVRIAAVLGESDESLHVTSMLKNASDVLGGVMFFSSSGNESADIEAISESGAQIAILSIDAQLVRPLLNHGIQVVLRRGCALYGIELEVNRNWYYHVSDANDPIAVQYASLCCRDQEVVAILLKWLEEGVPAYQPGPTREEIIAQHENALAKALARHEREQEFLQKVAERRQKFEKAE